MEPSDASMGHLINRAARLFRQLADQQLEPLGLSSGYLPVLTALMAAEQMSQKALTEHAGIEQPTMAATLARMERDKVIERRADANDKRSFLYSLAPSTRDQEGAIKKVIASLNETSIGSLQAAERTRFRTMLVDLIATLEQSVR